MESLIISLFTIPTITLFFLIVSFTVIVSCFGLIICRRLFHDYFNISSNTNDAVNVFAASMGMLYGLLLGLASVSAWDNLDNASSIVEKEASSISQLYRNVSILHDPDKKLLQQDIRNYLVFVIEVAWPIQESGKKSLEGSTYLTHFLRILSDYKVDSVEEQIFLKEVLDSYNKLVENRSLRMLEINSGIPGVFWFIILVGGILNILISYFVHLPSLRTHLLLTALYSALLSFMIFVLASLDRPFIGETSVSSDSYSNVLKNINNYDVMLLSLNTPKN